MLLLLRTQEPMPVLVRNKTWVTNQIQMKVPRGKNTYEWWLNFFQTTLRENWDKT